MFSKQIDYILIIFFNNTDTAICNCSVIDANYNFSGMKAARSTFFRIVIAGFAFILVWHFCFS